MKKCKDVLEGLISKATKVLIETSLLGEGVDVGTFSLAIFLDHIKTSKGYVQMKGRSRRKNSKFFVLENEHPNAFKPQITLLQAQEV